MDKFPSSNQGGIWRNKDATTSNRQPPYRGHIVVTEDMLKTLIVLLRNNAFPQDGQNPDEGPRINLSAWLNTAKEDGSKYFRIASSVYYGNEHNHLFEEGDVAQTTTVAAPEATTEAADTDFPF